jgi:hypothetical protein
VAAADVDAADLWAQSLAAQRFRDFQATVILTTTFPSGDAVTLRLRMLAVLQQSGISRTALARVTSEGALGRSSFLIIEHQRAPDDLWIYLPAVGSPRRLLSGNLGDSYLGSEFRYADLLQPEPDDYTATVGATETIDGEPCRRLEIVPREPRLIRAAGVSREVLWLRASNLVERRIEQYDRRDALLKIIDLPTVFVDAASGKVFPVDRRVRNVQTGASSTAVFEDIVVDRGVPTDLFSPARLGDRSW